ncbi:MAG: zf-HC2 domain-containing protein [Pseudomonadota bacterium]|nr:zf-HC2 domain-containing protein [Pseudomonadota bacterium]
MRCAEALRVQAYFDGELDALAAADVERHSEACAECSSLLPDLGEVRTALRQNLAYASAPPALRAKILRALDEESALEVPRPVAQLMPWRPDPFWRGAFSGVAGTALAAGLAFFVLAPPIVNQSLTTS